MPAVSPMVWTVVAAGLLILPGCGHGSTYEPQTTTRDPEIERTIASLEEAVNANDPAAVCALYDFPAANCTDVWRGRLARLALPIDLPVATIVYGCAGDARVAIATRATSNAINSVTVTPAAPGSVYDVGLGHRRSSLVIPRDGDCADSGGDAGDEPCDVANKWGAEDRRLGLCRTRSGR
jgi:hypothetical protein